MKRIPELLADYVQRWFVPRADYDEAQEIKQRAVTQAIRAEEHARQMFTEMEELMDRVYSSSYRPFEGFGDHAEVIEFRHNDVRIPAVAFGWQVRIPDSVFYTTRDPESELRRIKEHAANEFAVKFKEHIRKKLFNLPRQEERDQCLSSSAYR